MSAKELEGGNWLAECDGCAASIQQATAGTPAGWVSLQISAYRPNPPRQMSFPRDYCPICATVVFGDWLQVDFP